MCLLALARTRKMTNSEVEQSNKSNPHGIGISWVEDGKVIFKKGMTIEQFKPFYESFDHLPHIVHFRFRSAGSTSPELTHPFLATVESPLVLEYEGCDPVLFHNGTESHWKEELTDACLKAGVKIPDGEFSDTRAVAVIVGLLGPNVLKLKFSGRWIYMDTMDIRMFGDFIEDNGALFSNSTYKPWQNGYSFGGSMGFQQAYVKSPGSQGCSPTIQEVIQVPMGVNLSDDFQKSETENEDGTTVKTFTRKSRKDRKRDRRKKKQKTIQDLGENVVDRAVKDTKEQFKRDRQLPDRVSEYDDVYKEWYGEN
jgi:hypothetical protein